MKCDGCGKTEQLRKVSSLLLCECCIQAWIQESKK